MKKQTKVGIDCDGVIANFSLAFSQLLRKIYGSQLPLVTDRDMILAWDWDVWYPLSKKEISAAWDVLMEEEDFWETLKVLDIPQYRYLKAQLNGKEHIDVFFITSRAPCKGKTLTQQTMNWLSKMSWKNPQVIVTAHKGEVAHALGLNFFIDDKIENVLDVAHHAPKCRAYVLDYPYNRHPYEDFANLRRAKALREFVDDVVNHAGH